MPDKAKKAPAKGTPAVKNAQNKPKKAIYI